MAVLVHDKPMDATEKAELIVSPLQVPLAPPTTVALLLPPVPWLAMAPHSIFTVVRTRDREQRSIAL